MMQTPAHTTKTAIEVISDMTNDPGDLAEVFKVVFAVASSIACNDPDLDAAVDWAALENFADALDSAEERLIIAEGVEQARHERIEASAIRQEQAA